MLYVPSEDRMIDCVELREYADRILEMESEGDSRGCGKLEICKKFGDSVLTSGSS